MKSSTFTYLKLNEHEDWRWDSEFIINEPYYNASLIYKSIGEVLTFSQYGISIDMNEDGDGYKIYRMNEISDMFCDRNINKYAKITPGQTKSFKLKHHDILFNRTNSQEFVGRTGIFKKFSEEDIVFASYLIRVRTNEEEVLPEYLTAFLNTRYGIQDAKRRARRSINQSNINAEELKRIRIPILNKQIQQAIRELFDLSFKLVNKSELHYKQAEQTLLSELGLVGWKPKHQLSFVKSFSDTNYADRIDAEYFQPKYDEIKEILNRGKCVPLAKCFDLLSGTYFDYVDEGDVGVIKTKQLNDRFISFEVESKTSEKILRDNNLPEIRDKDVLFASMGVGSLGKANIYYEFENSIKGKFTIDSTIKIMRQKPNSEIRPELLALYMSSIIGQELIYQNIVGTSGIISIYKHYLENLPIPLLGRSIQDSLSASIMQAHKSRIKSNKLLDIAKRGVELAIEKSEEEAEKWLSEEVGKCQITM